MAKRAKQTAPSTLVQQLAQHNFLFKGLGEDWLATHLPENELIQEKLYSNRPIYTAFRPNLSIDYLYVVVSGGPIIIRSTPLDRIIALTYPGGCFGMRSLDFSYGRVCRAFPSLVESYKTADVVKIPVARVRLLYDESERFRERYDRLFELREKFQYHLLNCGAYPPQAVAALLRALIYQERSLNVPSQTDQTYTLDLPVDIIAHACQLNHRTVEQVLKGMTQVGLLKAPKSSESSGDWIHIVDAEGLKEVYGATRDKVPWWPLR